MSAPSRLRAWTLGALLWQASYLGSALIGVLLLAVATLLVRFDLWTVALAMLLGLGLPALMSSRARSALLRAMGLAWRSVLRAVAGASLIAAALLLAIDPTLSVGPAPMLILLGLTLLSAWLLQLNLRGRPLAAVGLGGAGLLSAAWATSAFAEDGDDQDWDDESSRDGMDFGSRDDDATHINPATGLLMVGGMGGFDMAGNPWGVDYSTLHEPYSTDAFGAADAFGSSSDSWDSGLSGSSWDDH